MSLPIFPDAWISVSRSALQHNYTAVRDLMALGNDTPPQIIAVVKANAYGHGAGETARVFQEAGADFFAVTTPNEAVELREAGIQGRILVFLPPLPDQIEAFYTYGLEATVTEKKALVPLADQSLNMTGRPMPVHLKIDTGMGRLGVLPESAHELAVLLSCKSGLTFAGIYTHFARALDKGEHSVRQQFAAFQRVLAGLERDGINMDLPRTKPFLRRINPGLRHCANSAALLRFPEMRLDAVRPGTILYGQYPSAAVPRLLDLQETWRLQARIVSVRDVPAGTAVGYGGEYVTRRATKLAVIPIGYADGFTVALASASSGWRGLKSLLRPPQFSVTVRGRRAPVVGRVAMQICTLDVTDIPGIAPGDSVTVPARRITASARLPRLYQERFE